MTGSSMRGYLFGFIGVVIFGLTLPATRVAVLELDAVFIAFGRGLVAALLAAVVLAATRSRPPPRADWARRLAYGIAVAIGFPLLMTLALRHVPASHAGVVLAVLPLLPAMASVAVAGERPSWGFWLCGVAGTIVVAGYALVSGGGGRVAGAGCRVGGARLRAWW